MWQTPVSNVSAAKVTPRSVSVARAALDVLDVQRDDVGVARELADAHALGVEHVEGDGAGLELGVVAVGAVGRALEAERLPVEPDAALEVARGDGDEVDAGDDVGDGCGAHARTLVNAYVPSCSEYERRYWPRTVSTRLT
jgi:hypothetical protein